jgi:parallel beta-helix repeat protein
MRVGFLAGRKRILGQVVVCAASTLVALSAAGCGASPGASGMGAAPPPLRLPPVSCTRYASPAGTDDGDGTRLHPYLSLQELMNSLRPGETGCLRPGTYRQSVIVVRGGTPGHPITVAGAPGGHARLLGAFWVDRGANYVTVRDLELDGSAVPGVPSPEVNAGHTTFYEVDVTNRHTGICFVLGGAAETYGMATHTTIARSRIHGCGALPPTHFDHGIYVAHSRGATIVDNEIYDNADWGIHLYPDAQGTRIEYNVIDGNGNGVIFAGTGDAASSRNYVEHNVLSNTTDGAERFRHDNNYGFLVTSFWGGTVGVDNVVEDNCLWRGVAGTINDAAGGFTAKDNRVADPLYVSRANADFRLRPGSPCIGYGPRLS